ncbi:MULTISPECIES: hypothetical protein [unclassified Actinomyces]|uniref:hypothetical protein n=1 Tax=unclassified Actinomyces TaxID=2609248 RepID=UPI0011BD9AD5|nr:MULTISPECIES: hypothetical protein [unclassified Actinomyces]
MSSSKLSERMWGFANRLGAPFVVSLMIVVLVLVGRLAWWGYQQLPPPRPSEPYCLVLSDEDVVPLLDEATNVYGLDEQMIESYWTCGVNGAHERGLYIQAARDADDVLVNYKDIGVSVLDTVSARPGARVRSVGDATVVSWIQGGDAYAGWFEGTAAVIFSTTRTNDDAIAATQAHILEELVVRHGAVLLDDVGFSSTPSPTPDPYWTP